MEAGVAERNTRRSQKPMSRKARVGSNPTSSTTYLAYVVGLFTTDGNLSFIGKEPQYNYKPA